MRMILCLTPDVASVGSSQAGPGRSDNTEQVIALSWAGLGDGSWLRSDLDIHWSGVRPNTHFPIVPPSSKPHTNCFTVRKPPPVARFGHHNIYLWAQNTSKTQKLLSLECGAQLGPGSLWSLRVRSWYIWPLGNTVSAVTSQMPGDPAWHLSPRHLQWHNAMTSFSHVASSESLISPWHISCCTLFAPLSDILKGSLELSL